MIQQLTPNIYSMQIPLPNNPLRNLNSYVIKTPERNLIIDTGFRQKECLAAMKEGIAELELDMSKTDLFITHFHADHSGLMGDIATPTSKVYMHEDDVRQFREQVEDDGYYEKVFFKSSMMRGYPEDALMDSLSDNPAIKLVAVGKVDFTPVTDQTKIQLGDITLTCIHTPGHTPGHTCLYIEKEEILFSGDHILFTITPNITAWPSLKDTLGTYLKSLEKIRPYKISKTFASHRTNGEDIYLRIDQLEAHHAERLAELLEIIRDHPGINCYDAAGYMTWSIRAMNWADFPATQKWFAVGEAASHVIHLEQLGEIRTEISDGIEQYWIV